MGVDPAFLGKITLFNQLDDDERSLLAQSMLVREVKVGDTLFKAGDVGDSMFIVHSGQVELFVRDKAGQKIVLHVAESGQFFGELSLLDGGARTATASIVGEGELWVLDREDLQQLFRKRPDAALDMLAAMGGMTRKANALLQARVSRNANEEAIVHDKGNIVMRVADWVAAFSGSITFLVLHAFFFTFWIVFNGTSWAFDPFPYNLLTMTVSLEAIMLSTLLLFSSNRSAARDAIRNNIEYDVNLKAELEVAHLHEKNDAMHAEMNERFARIEKALNIAPRTSKQLAAVSKD